MIDVFIDGSARPNPGLGGFGTVIQGDGLNITRSEKVSQYSTNNQCEYAALVSALEDLFLLRKFDCPITINSDSQLVILQMTDVQKANINGAYFKLYNQAIMLSKIFTNLKFNKIPREQNKEADRLANEGVDKWFL